MDTADFAHIDLPHVGKRVFRVGIAGNYGIDSDDIRFAADKGANYWVWGLGYGRVTEGIRAVLEADRERHVIAMLGGGVFGRQVRWSVENALRSMNIDYLDVFLLGWLGVTSRYSPGIEEVLVKLKEEGKIRAIGTSIHDRERAGALARDSAIDLFMLRYNAKHPGCEQDVFPHLAVRKPAVIAYTATAWRQLVHPLRGVEVSAAPTSLGAVPPLTPALCYRFCLTNPNVHVVLTGPQNRAQLAENLAVVGQGPLADDELAWVRDYGRQVKSLRKLDYV